MNEGQMSLLDILNEESNDNDEEAPSIFQHSPYYNDEGLEELFTVNQSSFKLLSLNVQSLNAKFCELKMYIENCCKSRFHAICLQETWLTDDFDLSQLQLEGYNLISKGKVASRHGGVAIYLKDSFNYNILSYSSAAKIWDGLFLEIVINESFSQTKTRKTIILGNIYRPPRDNVENYNTFTCEIEQILHSLQINNKDVAIAGDFNIDLLKINEKSIFNEYFETVVSHGFIPKITLPTRITSHSSTLIDNILVKLSKNFSPTTSGVLFSNISDHMPCFISLDYLMVEKSVTKFVKIWSRSTQSLNNFKMEIASKCTSDAFDECITTNPNKNYEVLDLVIQEAFNKHIPVKVVKFNKHKHKLNNWISHGLLRSIRFRDKLYKRMIKTPKDTVMHLTLKNNLVNYNKILKKLIKDARKAYYESCFSKFKHDVRKTWDTIKTVINKTGNKKDFPNFFLINGQYVSDKKIIADEFNKYYVNVGPKLASEIHTPPNCSFKDYLPSPVGYEFSFEKVNDQIVSKIIESLKPKSSTGIDGISNNVLKFIKNEILHPLTLIINQSIENGIFPDKLKVAKVVPVYKKNDSTMLENYRPISVLPSLSKVFERVMHTQLTTFFTKNNLFYKNQYGFRESHSTELAAVELTDRIINSMDKKETPLAIFLDLSKAFDTINHEILLNKLNFYGVKCNAYKLLESYLTNRKQCIALENTFSSLLPITTGVPQGSILGPLLFIIYLNDLNFASKMFHPVIYADDTALSATLSTFDTGGHDRDTNIINELGNITLWLKLNKLSLNVSKTKAILFHNVRKNVVQPKISINETLIEFVETFDYLGITLDKNVNWRAHIQKIRSKLSKVAGIMSKMKNILPENILRTLYNSLYLPHLNYGILCWKSKVNELVKLQKKAVRIISKEKYNAHTNPLFKKLNLLKISDLEALQVLKFCYKLEHDRLPAYFQSNLFKRNSELRTRMTRASNDFYLPKVRTEFAKNSIQYIIPLAFNNCPPQIKEKIYSHSLPGFCRYIKSHYINQYNDICIHRNCFVCQR